MAFKSFVQYNEEKNENFFRLKDDGDSANVIFLYRSINDVLVADVHYIKSDEYSGYVHCLENNCPACKRKLRIQKKLFIPLYNLDTQRIEFFDRTIRFEPQLEREVFKLYPNPSEIVFKITRHGEYGTRDTSYSIRAVGRAPENSYEDILKKFNTSLPAHYDVICKSVDAFAMNNMLSNADDDSTESDEMPEYTPMPRVSFSSDTEAPKVDDLPFSEFNDEEDEKPLEEIIPF